MSFKTKPTPKPPARPPAIRMPPNKTLVPNAMAGNDDDALRQQSPDMSSAGYTVMPSGRRQFKEEIPWEPATPPEHKPFKVK